MKLIIIAMMMTCLSNAKEFQAHLTDCLYIKYIDTDNNRYFDSLVVNDCGNVIIKNLSTTIMKGRPNKEDYKNAIFVVRLINYNNIKNDAYFQVLLIKNDKVIGYWEHIMGSYGLIWRSDV